MLSHVTFCDMCWVRILILILILLGYKARVIYFIFVWPVCCIDKATNVSHSLLTEHPGDWWPCKVYLEEVISVSKGRGWKAPSDMFYSHEKCAPLLLPKGRGKLRAFVQGGFNFLLWAELFLASSCELHYMYRPSHLTPHTSHQSGVERIRILLMYFVEGKDWDQQNVSPSFCLRGHLRGDEYN